MDILSEMLVASSERCRIETAIRMEYAEKVDKAFEEYKQILINGPSKWERYLEEKYTILTDPDFRKAVDTIQARYAI